eukprot:TRINITY_DN13576_c0_g1_i1.p1 TRINITY_DN13576_c0_g1~~TRINITY_DN13576_c0_g1_i1.p1  ORF type:complete len:171 (+),score=20.48 TRINITY_DN13576_c0_g1_i1:355-867(+)
MKSVRVLLFFSVAVAGLLYADAFCGLNRIRQCEELGPTSKIECTKACEKCETFFPEEEFTICPIFVPRVDKSRDLFIRGDCTSNCALMLGEYLRNLLFTIIMLTVGAAFCVCVRRRRSNEKLKRCNLQEESGYLGLAPLLQDGGVAVLAAPAAGERTHYAPLPGVQDSPA